jgi:hypothetical protein
MKSCKFGAQRLIVRINCTKKKNIYIYHISCDKVQKLHHQDDEPNIFYIKVSNPRKCMMEAESKISQNLVASELRLVKAVNRDDP